MLRNLSLRGQRVVTRLRAGTEGMRQCACVETNAVGHTHSRFRGTEPYRSFLSHVLVRHFRSSGQATASSSRQELNLRLLAPSVERHLKGACCTQLFGWQDPEESGPLLLNYGFRLNQGVMSGYKEDRDKILLLGNHLPGWNLINRQERENIVA